MLGPKIFVPPLFALLVLVAGCGSVQDQGEPGVGGSDSGVTRQIAGNWAGKLHQKGLSPFEIAVDIGPDSTGEVAYAGIDCGGGWTLAGVQASVPPRYSFIEKISEGAGGSCKGTGKVSLSPIQQDLPNEPAYNQLNYGFTGGGVSSRGLLHRTDPESVARVFREAGVRAP